jgi:hypothetical protein
MNQPSATGQVEIGAPPAEVYRIVSDLPMMARLTEETEQVTWLGGATAARPGVRFRGRNRRAGRRWSTVGTITDAEPDRLVGYEVSALGIPVARWQYEIEPCDAGCRVTESTWDRRPGWMRGIANLAFGVRDRAATNRENIERTLGRLKADAEPAG